MFRLIWTERYALQKLADALPRGAIAFLYGSRVDPLSNGGDVDVLVELEDGDEIARFETSVAAARAYHSVCEGKVDVTVIPRHERSQEIEAFVRSLRVIPLQEVLGTPRLDHVAFVVTDLTKTMSYFKPMGFSLSTPRELPQEGTREVYVGEEGRSGRILLLQPIGVGPYERALAKRGPGLHHIGLSTTSIAAVGKSALSSAWKEHRHSAEQEVTSTRWYSKPGIQTLLEVFEAPFTRPRPLQAVVQAVDVATTITAEALEQAWPFSVIPELNAAASTRLNCPGGWIDEREFI